MLKITEDQNIRISSQKNHFFHKKSNKNKFYLIGQFLDIPQLNIYSHLTSNLFQKLKKKLKNLKELSIYYSKLIEEYKSFSEFFNTENIVLHSLHRVFQTKKTIDPLLYQVIIYSIYRKFESDLSNNSIIVKNLNLTPAKIDLKLWILETCFSYLTKAHPPNLSFTNLEMNNEIILKIKEFYQRNVRYLSSRGSSLVLSNNKLRSSGGKLISEIVNMNLVTKLALNSNEISSEGFQSLCVAISKNKNTKNFEFMKNIIEHKDMKILAETIRENENLSEVNISKNRIKDEGLRILESALINTRSLLVLKIGYCNITAKSNPIIHNILKNNKILVEFDIRNNSIGNIGVETILCAIHQNKESNLKKLDISQNHFDIKSLTTLKDIIVENQVLTHISLKSFKIQKHEIVKLLSRVQSKICRELKFLMEPQLIIECLGHCDNHEALNKNRQVQEHEILNDSTFSLNDSPKKSVDSEFIVPDFSLKNFSIPFNSMFRENGRDISYSGIYGYKGADLGGFEDLELFNMRSKKGDLNKIKDIDRVVGSLNQQEEEVKYLSKKKKKPIRERKNE